MAASALLAPVAAAAPLGNTPDPGAESNVFNTVGECAAFVLEEDRPAFRARLNRLEHDSETGEWLLRLQPRVVPVDPGTQDARVPVGMDHGEEDEGQGGQVGRGQALESEAEGHRAHQAQRRHLGGRVRGVL